MTLNGPEPAWWYTTIAGSSGGYLHCVESRFPLLGCRILVLPSTHVDFLSNVARTELHCWRSGFVTLRPLVVNEGCAWCCRRDTDVSKFDVSRLNVLHILSTKTMVNSKPMSLLCVIDIRSMRANSCSRVYHLLLLWWIPGTH